MKNKLRNSSNSRKFYKRKLTRSNNIQRYPIGSGCRSRRCRRPRPRSAITFILTIAFFKSSRYTGSWLFCFPQFHIFQLFTISFGFQHDPNTFPLSFKEFIIFTEYFHKKILYILNDGDKIFTFLSFFRIHRVYFLIQYF